MRQLPNTQIQIIQWESQTVSRIQQGDVTIGINYFPIKITKEIRQQPVAQSTSVFIVRKGHPWIIQGATLESLSDYPIIGMITPEVNDYHPVMKTELRGRDLHFSLRSMHLPTLFQQISNSDAVMVGQTIPALGKAEDHICIAPAWLYEYQSVPYSYALYSLERHQHQPLMEYLKTLCIDIIKQQLNQAEADFLYI